MRMYPRSEFPTEVLPPVIRPNGTINRAAISMRFSNAGCPHGNVDVTVAAIKSGVNLDAAFHLGMLACYAKDADIHNVERIGKSLFQVSLEQAASRSPRSVYAYLKAKLGAGYRYITAGDVSNASMNDYAGWSAWANSKDAA